MAGAFPQPAAPDKVSLDAVVSAADSAALAKARAELQMTETKEAQGAGWRATLTCWLGVFITYNVLQAALPWLVPSQPAAEEFLHSQVPARFYQYSEAAFFTAAVLNLLSFVFEETQEKRQLAVLSALIKGLSWHCDYLIIARKAVVVFDGYNAILMPSRYVQWSCTTPTMLFTLAKISDFSERRVALVMFCDWMMILTGYIAALYPPGFVSYFSVTLSFVFFYIVLYNLHCMIRSALTEANTHHARLSLHFTFWSTLVIWHLFPIGWVISRFGPQYSWIGEVLSMFSNFGAKVVFSSCILYNNYVTLQQRRIAAQVEQEHKDRIRMVAELRAAVQNKDEFISVIGHELRTPLNAIIQLSSAIMSNFGAPGTWQKHYVWMETITRSAQHLMGIINDIITIRAARSGMHLKQELVHVGHVVDHVVRTLSPMAKRGVVMEKAVTKQLPPIVADERRVIQVLSNLLSNALKFTERGKVSISVRADRGGRNVVVKIIDTGCGIPKSELKNLLVPFKQVDMSVGRKYGGTGLGLSIANQLVQAHSGSLELQSGEGEGTTVVVKLPVLQPETRPMLEAPFKLAYTSAGYDYESLMSPEAAKTEGRRLAVFRNPVSSLVSSTISSRTSPRSSTDSMSMGMHVEQFCWDDYYDNGAGPDAAVSAAASNQGGPPPMAVALVSSLYSSAQKPARSHEFGAAQPPVVLTKLPPVTSDVSSQGAAGTRAQPSADAWGQASQQQQHQGLHIDRMSPGQADSAPSSGSMVVNSAGANVVPVSTGLLPLDEQAGPEEGGMDEMDEYAGSWHRAPKFGDDHDADKGYYSYDSRMSYEYRPSIDRNSGHDWVRKVQAQQGAKSPGAAPITSVFRRLSMSLNSSLRNSRDDGGPRTSRDSVGRPAPAGTSQSSGSNIVTAHGDMRSSQAKVKLLDAGNEDPNAGATGWQVTRKAM